MKKQDQEVHHAAGRSFRGQRSREATATHRGAAYEGRSFYVWDEDRQSAAAWADQLAEAAPYTPRWIHRNRVPGATGFGQKEPVE
jgi:hypothetical protein